MRKMKTKELDEEMLIKQGELFLLRLDQPLVQTDMWQDYSDWMDRRLIWTRLIEEISS